MALTLTIKYVLFIHQLCSELGVELKIPTVIFKDNDATIALAKHSINHERTKHINIKHHFSRDHLWKSKIILSYIPNKNTVSDILPKIVNLIERHFV